MIPIANGLLRPKQIYLPELLSVDRVLASRGFVVASEGEGKDTIFPTTPWTNQIANIIFDSFDDTKTRVELKKFVDKNISGSTSNFFACQNLPGVNLTKEAFTKTFEWYVGELLVRRFKALSSSYGVKIDGTIRPGGVTTGDYDVLSILGDTSLLYVECKTGKFNDKKILAMVERSHVLHCSASIMFVGSKVGLTQLRQSLRGAIYPGHAGPGEVLSIHITGAPDSMIFAWHDAYFVPADASSGEVERRMRTVLRLIAAQRVEILRGMGISNDDYRRLGFSVGSPGADG